MDKDFILQLISALAGPVSGIALWYIGTIRKSMDNVQASLEELRLFRERSDGAVESLCRDIARHNEILRTHEEVLSSHGTRLTVLDERLRSHWRSSNSSDASDSDR